jgi:hypothetical protein
VLAIWGTLGFFEYLTGHALVVPLQNSNFPSGTQFLHWVLATSTGFAFLFGFFKKWKHTPYIMVMLYSCLTTLCFIETFDFMTKESRYGLYATEVAGYVMMSVYLLKSIRMKKHFGR